MNAVQFAIEAHGDQKYGVHPYGFHLLDVHNILIEFGEFDDDLLTAAWLHDVLEDTAADGFTIFGMFGKRVWELVCAVTNEPGANRKERHLKTYPKIARDPMAITLKQADRIANMRASAASTHRLRAMYHREYSGFRAALEPHGGNLKMWDELDRLAALPAPPEKEGV
jgi:(p)ppGpp synthase/HD superfamily hydrolase